MENEKTTGFDLVSSSKCYLKYGVADEDRTRNPQSGNLMLHHLSYSDIKGVDTG